MASDRQRHANEYERESFDRTHEFNRKGNKFNECPKTWSAGQHPNNMR